jgi:hypothetical protein
MQTHTTTKGAPEQGLDHTTMTQHKHSQTISVLTLKENTHVGGPCNTVSPPHIPETPQQPIPAATGANSTPQNRAQGKATPDTPHPQNPRRHSACCGLVARVWQLLLVLSCAAPPLTSSITFTSRKRHSPPPLAARLNPEDQDFTGRCHQGVARGKFSPRV